MMSGGFTPRHPETQQQIPRVGHIIRTQQLKLQMYAPSHPKLKKSTVIMILTDEGMFLSNSIHL